MPFETNALSSQLLAQVLGTLTLRTGAVAAQTFGTEIAIEKPESAGAGTILHSVEVREALSWDLPDETIAAFLRSLTAGRLDNARYDLAQESLRTPKGTLHFSRTELTARQNPLDPSLTRPPVNRSGEAVPLTVAGAFLDKIVQIPATAFEEAAFRALGFREAESLDLLWLHAGEGELRRYDVTSPVVLCAQPPEGVSLRTYREFPMRFPLVCLQYERSQWRIQPRHVISRPDTRDRLMAVLKETTWDLQIAPGPKSRQDNLRQSLVDLIRQTEPPLPAEEDDSKAPGPRPVPYGTGHVAIPPPPPLPRESLRMPKPARPRPEPKPAAALPVPESKKAVPPPPPAKKRPPAVSEIFFRPHVELLRKGSPGIVAITEAEILVEHLDLIPKEYFDRAVRLCFGVRDPHPGDRVVLLAGESFSKKGRIRDCLFVAPEVPENRKSAAYPKITLEYRSGTWAILPKSLRGHGHADLFRAVTTLTDWGIVPPPEDNDE
jgi:hypothetical protein